MVENSDLGMKRFRTGVLSDRLPYLFVCFLLTRRFKVPVLRLAVGGAVCPFLKARRCSVTPSLGAFR